MVEPIVPFTVERLDACTRLFVDTFNREPWRDRWTLDSARQRLLQVAETPGFIGFVLCPAADGVVGFAFGHTEPWFDGEHFCIREFCIRHDCWRQGFGTRLLRHLERALTARRIDRVFLLTVRAGPAETFYRKNGYTGNPRMLVMSRRMDCGE